MQYWRAQRLLKAMDLDLTSLRRSTHKDSGMSLGTTGSIAVSNRQMRLLRSTISWVVTLLGILVSYVAIIELDTLPVLRDGFPPEWPRASLLAFLALFPPLAVAVALCSRRHAGLLLLTAAPVLGAWSLFLPSEASTLLDSIQLLLISSLFFAIPGAFYFFTGRAGWPPLVAGGKLRVIVGGFLFTAWAAFGFIASVSKGVSWGDLPRRWNSTVLYAQPFPDHVVFTGRVVLVGNAFPYDKDSSGWCVMRVEHRYWGLPVWALGLVVVRGYFKKGERGDYLVDGTRSPELTLHFLPVIEPYGGCHLARTAHAKADLRVLNDGPPRSGVRVVGWVYRDPDRQSAAGAPVHITDPGGSTSVTTDLQGVYDRTGLPPGHYKVEVAYTGPIDDFNAQFSHREADVQAGEAWGGTLYAGPQALSPQRFRQAH